MKQGFYLDVFHEYFIHPALKYLRLLPILVAWGIYGYIDMQVYFRIRDILHVTHPPPQRLGVTKEMMSQEP
jgi:hypothetical protein